MLVDCERIEGGYLIECEGDNKQIAANHVDRIGYDRRGIAPSTTPLIRGFHTAAARGKEVADANLR